ncbi:MAG: type I restriction-modification system subunit M N-terminal domain-containing protein [Chromatiaceae bacterium]|nr:type I restriction-modification system subunit M N-terminal domain-containing protein [Chromatiaceae bacterium]MBP8289018.1 type I restriction-modification system subunit M N-terminal domain-containing protein [Chromatiaceae bacterium]
MTLAQQQPLINVSANLRNPVTRGKVLLPSASSSGAAGGAGNKTRVIASTQSLSSFVKSICDSMRRSNCASALQYVPELTWILFLRILDAQETRDREAAEALGKSFAPALHPSYRWQDWAAPYDDKAEAFTPEGKRVGWKREEHKVRAGNLLAFINGELLPYLHGLDILQSGPNTGRGNPYASPKQRVIGRIMTTVERVRMDSETNL